MALYIIYKSEHTYLQSTKRSIIVQSRHKKGLIEAFRSTPLGVTTTTQVHQDLILHIRFFKNLINSDLRPVTGSQASDESPIIMSSTSIEAASTVACSPLSHIISICHNGTDIEQDLRKLVYDQEYGRPLQLKIQKDYGWFDQQFQAVHWPSYYKAIRRIPQSHRISITKLTHTLWNTNAQNQKYYGQRYVLYARRSPRISSIFSSVNINRLFSTATRLFKTLNPPCPILPHQSY